MAHLTGPFDDAGMAPLTDQRHTERQPKGSSSRSDKARLGMALAPSLAVDSPAGAMQEDEQDDEQEEHGQAVSAG